MITKLYIQNFKGFRQFPLALQSKLNIVVGNNETGKSTILEALALALTKRLNGRQIEGELSIHLFNKDAVAEYVTEIQAGSNPALPSIIIDAYFADSDNVSALSGSNNYDKTDAPGVRLEIAFNNDYAEEYQALLQDRSSIKTIPVEYYCVHWCSFAGSALTTRSIPVGVSYIDAATIRLQSGTDFYLQSIISSGLDPKERVALSLAYRGLKEKFSEQGAIQDINTKLTQRKGAITDKELSINIDVSQKSNWEANLTPHLDDLPFQLIGKGEQSALKIMLALERQADASHVILIEEPENHLSYASMQKLITKIRERCEGKQIILTTHSAYVLNKLGVESTILLHNGTTASLSNLPAETERYFKKLSGYDTLRIILADRSILVEGPSDELIVQKAYLKRHKRLPSEDGVDVINVRGLSFPRFLDIAKELKKKVAVVTDNDGAYQKKVLDRYRPYAGLSFIQISADPDETAPTLEYQIAKSNNLELLNMALGSSFGSIGELTQHMVDNKTECALKIFESAVEIEFPAYIEAVL